MKGPVRIGNDQGSGYFFCGDISDFDPMEIDREFSAYWDEKYRYARVNLEKLKREPATIERYISTPEKEWTLEGFTNYIRNYLREYTNARVRKELLEVRRNTCKPVLDRTIVETRDAITSGAKIIIVKGYESYAAWDEQEFHRKYKRSSQQKREA